MQDLALNGCKGVTDELFASLEHAGQPLPLQTLSVKHTKGLQTCWLGLAPANPEGVPEQAAGSGAANPVGKQAWQPAPTSLAGAQPLTIAAASHALLLSSCPEHACCSQPKGL